MGNTSTLAPMTTSQPASDEREFVISRVFDARCEVAITVIAVLRLQAGFVR